MSIEAMKPLPCPFCGGTDIATHEGTSFRWHVAECMTCGAQGSEVRRQTLGQGTTDLWIEQAAADAIKEWNTRAAIEQAEKQEPVAWMYEFGTDHGDAVHEIRWYPNVHWKKPTGLVRNIVPLYTAPPQREWQGLTENEIKHLWYEACQTNLELTSQLIVHLAKNIEAKLREKNA